MTDERVLLDLFCGAGGAAMGYSQAGFTRIIGVDHKPQPRYPFEFVLADAMTFPLEGYDLIHASPPCQLWVDSANKDKHLDLITPLRPRLEASGTPYVIENVDKAPLLNPLLLCGTMFDLRVIRHRLFEMSEPVYFTPATCCHWGRVSQGDYAGVYGRGARGKRWGNGKRDARPFRWGQVPEGRNKRDWWSSCMGGVGWMTTAEMTQAVPPAYTRFIGAWALEYLERQP